MGVRSKILHVSCAKGFVDKTPKFMRERQIILDIINNTYKKNGADKLETPVFELKEVFANKRNQCKELLDLDDQGGEILALRYDLKHPLIRYLSMNKIEKHMKLTQSGYIYRNEKIDLKKIRLREFFVSDFDICGPSDPMVTEVQCLKMCLDIIKDLELNEPIKLVMGHKKITESLLRIAANISDSQAVKLIGKVSDDTIGSAINWETIEKHICDKKITKDTLVVFRDLIMSLNGDFESVITRLEAHENLNTFKESKPVISDLTLLKEYCKSFLTNNDIQNISFDFNLIGARNFYSGLAFAVQLRSNNMVIMSGGRYDNLVGKINPKGKDRIGCTGFSVGVDQLTMYRLAKQGFHSEISTGNSWNDCGDLSDGIRKTVLEDNTVTDIKPAVQKQVKGTENSIEDGVLKIVKGTMDRGPQQMAIREHVFQTITECFKRHGACTIDTPVVERHDVLTGKYGEDSKLIYDLNDVEEEKLSMRYDLTVPFARYLAMHNNVFDESPLFKRYQIGKVYRRDNPSMSRGRYREFYQCDFDIAGHPTSSMQSDSECLHIVYEVLRDLRLGDYVIKVNHRKFLDGLLAVCGVPTSLFRAICSSIDKLDKSPWETVKLEMIEKGVSSETAARIGQYVALSGGIDLIDRLEHDTNLASNEDVRQALEEMRVLLEYCVDIADRVRFDLSLARGLDYYTGMIFEAVFVGFESSTSTAQEGDENGEAEDQPVAVGSVSGGGRYDQLVGMFSGEGAIPCVGLSLGVERLMAIYEASCRRRQSGVGDLPLTQQVMVISAQKNMIAHRFELLRLLLDAGIPATHSMKRNPKALDVFQECERLRIPLAVIVGEDELALDSVKLRYIKSRDEEMVLRASIIDRLRAEFHL